MGLLHVQDHQRDEGRRQQAGALPVDPPAQREGQRHRAQVKKRRQRPPHEERVHIGDQARDQRQQIQRQVSIGIVGGNVKGVQSFGPAQAFGHPHDVPLVRVCADAAVPVEAVEAEGSGKN